MEKKSKKSIVIGISALMLATLTLLGLSYAYYRTRIVRNESEKSISIQSKELEVTYSENSSLVTASNFGPGSTLTKTFSVENTGSDKGIFTIVFENVTNTFIYESDIRYELLNTTTQEKTDGFIRNFLIEGYETQKIKANIEIDSGSKYDYELKIQYANLPNDDQSIDMGKQLSLKVNIIGEIDNPKMVLAENAYQDWVISHRYNYTTLGEKTATTYVKSRIKSAGLDDTDVMVFENRAVVGSFVKAINAGAEIGDCVDYDSPERADATCDWRILGPSENGELEVVTKVTSNTEGIFSCPINAAANATSTPGYDRGEEILDNCAKKFANGYNGITSRSITVEDVNRVTGYSPMNVGVKDPYNVGTYYEEGTLREHLNEVTFSWGPGTNGTSLFVKGSNNVSIEDTTPETFYPLNESNYDWTAGEEKTFTYIRDYYSYYPTTLTSTSGSSLNGLSIGSKAYKMLFEGTDEDDKEYWLANKYIDIKSSSDNPVINWGMRIVSGERVTGITFWDSRYKNLTSSDYTEINWGNANIKPVVNISNNKNITKRTTDSTTGLNVFNII